MLIVVLSVLQSLIILLMVVLWVVVLCLGVLRMVELCLMTDNAVGGCTLCAVDGCAVDSCIGFDCFMADHAVGGCTLCIDGCAVEGCTRGRYPGNRSLFWKPETRVNYFVQIICSVV